MDIQIDISGIEGIEKYLNSAPEKLLEGTLAGANGILSRIKDDATNGCPVREINGGNLRDSIHVSEAVINGQEIEGDVSNNTEYAVFVEMGTGQRGRESPSPPKSPDDVYHREDWVGMSAQPFMYPAYVNAQDEAPKIVKENIIKKLKE